MKKQIFRPALLALVACSALTACKKLGEQTKQNSFDKLLMVTTITSANPPVSYIGTLKDLSVGSYNNSKARQSTSYPFITLYKDFVFVVPNKRGDVLQKYQRQADGSLSDAGSLSLPASSNSIQVVVESDTKAYLSLENTGKIAIFNPTTMVISSYIDLRKYALGDASPDPAVMALRNGKLYVACVQTTDGYTSSHPAQVLIIDTANGNSITSTTDSRTAWAGGIDEKNSIFFDENGDMYIFCVASYGFMPGQKCGFLRIKSGQTAFDPTYFFNVADYSIADIPNNKVDYLQHMHYTASGILYATGNIYALASNPPNYVTDRTMGSFKVDLYNKTITKLNLPYSNGYAASVMPYDGKILFGLSTSTGVGIYTYEPLSGTASAKPVVITQGDPSAIEVF